MVAGMDGKVALITGGGSGIGEASAKRFAQDGAKVLVVDIHEDSAAQVELDGGTMSTHNIGLMGSN